MAQNKRYKTRHNIKKQTNYRDIILAVCALIAFTVLIVLFVNFCSNSCSAPTNETENQENQETQQEQEITGAALGSYTHTDTRLAKSTSNNKTKPDRPVCYLTFDDGPSSNTERILDILNKNNIKATWFVKASNQDINKAKTIWDNGNQVVVHTFTHDYKQIYASTDAFWNDYNKAYSALEQTLGFKPANMLRFPGGSVNSYNTKIAKNLIAQAAEKNIHYFDWNQSCGDGATHTSDELVFYATDGADKLNSVCLLMHDSQAKNTTVEALERIIQFYKSKGYSFEYLTEDSYNYSL